MHIFSFLFASENVAPMPPKMLHQPECPVMLLFHVDTHSKQRQESVTTQTQFLVTARQGDRTEPKKVCNTNTFTHKYMHTYIHK